jgi:hypothetical protein
VMLEGIALLAIVTAAITSTFVQRAVRERNREASEGEAEERHELAAQFDSLDARLERIEASLRDLTKS